jgi:hypothetical protein
VSAAKNVDARGVPLCDGWVPPPAAALGGEACQTTRSPASPRPQPPHAMWPRCGARSPRSSKDRARWWCSRQDGGRGTEACGHAGMLTGAPMVPALWVRPGQGYLDTVVGTGYCTVEAVLIEHWPLCRVNGGFVRLINPCSTPLPCILTSCPEKGHSVRHFGHFARFVLRVIACTSANRPGC